MPLAKNALRKLRTLRHPDILRFIDGHETDTAVYIITEPVEPLTARIGPEGERPGSGEEWKVWGLSRIAVRFALATIAFELNRRPIRMLSNSSTRRAPVRTAIFVPHRSSCRLAGSGVWVALKC